MRHLPLAALVVSAAAVPAAAQAAVAAPPQAEPVSKSVFAAIKQVCLPLVAGGDLPSVKASSGLTEVDGAPVLARDGSPPVGLRLPNRINPNTCEISVPLDQAQALKDAIDRWEDAPAPLTKVRDRESRSDALGPRVVTTWIGESDGQRLVLVVSQPDATAEQDPVATVVLSVERG